MNITTEPTINLHLILTGDEARAFLADPHPLQSLVRDELAKQHRRNANESATLPTAASRSGSGGKKTPFGSDARLRKNGHARKSIAAFTCDECGKTFLTEGRYKNHLRDVHQQEAFPNFAHAAESDSL